MSPVERTLSLAELAPPEEDAVVERVVKRVVTAGWQHLLVRAFLAESVDKQRSSLQWPGPLSAPHQFVTVFCVSPGKNQTDHLEVEMRRNWMFTFRVVDVDVSSR